MGCDLRKSPLMRHYLIRLAEDRWHFVWGSHHILIDGWSFSVLMKDLFHCYTQLTEGSGMQPVKTSRYRQYVDWIQSLDHEPARQFFTRYLQDFNEPTPLPVSPHYRSYKSRGSAYAETRLLVDEELVQKIQQHCRSSKLTLNMVFQGLWALLLSAYSGKRDVVFGSIYSGRMSSLPDIDRIVGLFINALPIRLLVDEEQAFSKWMADFTLIQAEIQELQQTPLRVVQKCTSIPADQHLFESLYVYQNHPERLGGEVPCDNLSIESARTEERNNYPMTFLIQVEAGIELVLCHDPERFPEKLVERMMEHLQTMLTRLSGDFSMSVGEVRKLPPEQLMKLDELSCSRELAKAKPTTLDMLARHSDDAGLAVVAGDFGLTYHELESLVESWSSIGTFSEERIGLCFDRSVGMVVAMLAIMRCGAAYVPIDPGWPAERIRWIITDAGLRVVVAGKGRAGKAIQEAISSMSQGSEVQLVEMDPESPAEPHMPSGSKPSPPGPGSLAYIIYTSGSTGTPKGVLVEHANAVSSTMARLSFYPSSPSRFLLLSPIFFDSSVAGLFWTMASAGTLVLPEPGMEREPEQLANLIMREKITHFLCLPSLYGAILEYLNRLDCSLEAVIVAGEACPAGLPAYHREVLPGVSLYNEYGPTEATVWCTVADITRIEEGGLIHIGRPIPDARIFIADDQFNQLPLGSTGEIMVAGPGVARGYLNQPALTEERFVEIKLAAGNHSRVYRTGDLGRWLEDGSIEFLGRIDRQVKIRGYRIETGEIQAVMESHPQVSEAEVVCVQREGAPSRLAGFVKSAADGHEVSIPELRDYLSTRIPEYMVPALIREVSKWPLLSNGKVDHHALTRQISDQRGSDRALSRTGAPPQPALDNLEAILADVLGVDQLGPEDNFFALGGDSILAIQAVSRARKAGIALTVGKLLNAATLGDLDVGTQASNTEPLVQESPVGQLPITPIQSWLLEKKDLDHDWWNNSVLVKLDHNVSADTLSKCLDTLVRHHDALRLAVHRSATGWSQRIPPASDVPVEVKVVQSSSPIEDSEELIQSTANRLHGSIRLQEGRPLRAVVFECGEQRSRHLLIIIHHMVVDWVSWKILLEDLEYIINETTAGRYADLPAKTSPFRKWAESLSAYSESDTLLQELDFWKGQPYEDCRPADSRQIKVFENKESTEKFITFGFSIAETRQLVEASRIIGVGMDSLLLGGLARVLAEWQNTPAIQIDLEGHGREEIIADLDTTRTVGWFTSQYPLALVPLQQASMKVFFLNIQAQLEEVPNKGIGYGVLKYMSRQSEQLDDIQDSLVVFNYLGKLDDTAASGLLSKARWSVGKDRSDDSLRTSMFEINTFIQEECLTGKWAYSSSLHDAATVEDLGIKMKKFLLEAALAITSADPLVDCGLDDQDLKTLLDDSEREARDA